jgi:ethanolamine utilization protein EutQ (cupin superfamily)
MKIIKANEWIKRNISDSYLISNLLTSNQCESLSVAVSDANNINKTTQTSSDRVYYILEWEFLGNDELVAKKWDLIFIPGNTKYNFKGNFKAVLINSPAFKKENEINF